MREEAVGVGIFGDIGCNGQKLRGASVQFLERLDRLVELFLATAGNNDSFSACADPDSCDCLVESQIYDDERGTLRPDSLLQCQCLRR